MVSKTASAPFNADDVTTAKTYVALLTEGALRHESQPHFETLGTDTHDPEKTFCLRISMKTTDPIVKNIVKTAQGRNKKTTKHRAAKEMLLAIIDECDDYYVWGIPGMNKTTARLWIEELMPELVAGGSVNSSFETMAMASDGTDLTSNAVGRLAQMYDPDHQGDHVCRCTRHSLPVPVYEETRATVTGEDNTFTFTIEVRCGLATTEGSARNKKTAKNMAAAEMYKSLLDIQEEQRIQQTLGDCVRPSISMLIGQAFTLSAVDELADVSEASEMPPVVGDTPRLSREYVLDGDSPPATSIKMGEAIVTVKTCSFDAELAKTSTSRSALDLLVAVCEQEARLADFVPADSIHDVPLRDRKFVGKSITITVDGCALVSMEHGATDERATNNACLSALQVIQSIVYDIDPLKLEKDW